MRWMFGSEMGSVGQDDWRWHPVYTVKGVYGQHSHLVLAYHVRHLLFASWWLALD